jgi:hypothetical protein
MARTLNDATAENRRFLFRLNGTGGSAITGFTPTKIILIKNGTYAAGAGTWTQSDATNAAGWYYYEATQAEFNTAGQFAVEITGATLFNGYAFAGDQIA